MPVERYTPERKAEFLLSNAVDEADYRRARKEVAKLGIDPDSIAHHKPLRGSSVSGRGCSFDVQS